MGIFKRNKKKEDTDLLNINYDNFSKALTEAVSVGSKDAKQLVIYTEDNDIYNVYFDGDELRYATSKQYPLELEDRLFWINEKFTNEQKEDILKLSNNFENIHEYFDIIEKYPDFADTLDEILSSYTFTVLTKLYKNKIQRIETEVLFGKEAININYLTFFALEPEPLEKEIKQTIQYTSQNLNSILGKKHDNETFTKEELETKIKLNIDEDDYEATNDIERLIFIAAQTNRTITEIEQVSNGFVYNTILLKINELINKNIIKLVDEKVEEEILLPELPLEELIEPEEQIEEPETTQQETEEQIEELTKIQQEEPATTNNDFKQKKFKNINFKKEETQEESAFDINEDNFIFNDDELNITPAIKDKDFVNEILELIERKDIAQQNLELSDKIIDKTKENLHFEEIVDELNVSIFKLTNQYNESLTQVGNEIIEQNNIDETDKEKTTQLFFEIEKNEKDRNVVNEHRTVLLKEIKEILAEIDDENIQDLIYQIDNKLNYIESIENLAYQEKEQHQEIDILNDSFGQLVLGPITEKTEIPIFFDLVEKFGFNPLEEQDIIEGTFDEKLLQNIQKNNNNLKEEESTLVYTTES